MPKATAFLTGAALAVSLLGQQSAAADDQISWTSATALTDTVEGVSLGNVAYTEPGDTFAAWTQKSGSNYQPKISRAGTTPRISWSLDSATAAQSYTRLAMSSDGTVGLAVYQKLDASVRNLYWSRWDGTSWSSSELLATNVSSATAPAIDLNDDGSFGVVAWESQAASVFAARFDGAGFKPVDTLASGTSGNLSMAVAGSRAMAGWIRDPGTGRRLETRSWSGSSWAAPRDVSQNTGGVETPSGKVFLSADGSISGAIWPVLTAGQWSVRTARGNGDTWQAPSTLHSGTYDLVQAVDLALSADGSAAFAVWSAQPGSGMTVYQSRYTSGAWSGATVMAGPFTSVNSPTPDVAISHSGKRGVVAYQQRSNAEYRSRAQIFGAGAWGSAVSLGVTTSNSASGITQTALSKNGTLGAAVLVQQSGGQQSLAISELTIRTTPDAPAAPKATLVTIGGSTRASVSWTPTDFDGNSPITDYLVEADQPNTYCEGEFEFHCSVSMLTAGKPYRFRVTAYNSFGASEPSAWSNAVALPPNPDPKPVTKISVKRIKVKQRKRKGTKRKVVIRWTTTGPATAQQIRIKQRGKKWKRWVSVPKPRKVRRLKAGKVYRVAVKVTNAAGTSPAKVKRVRVRR